MDSVRFHAISRDRAIDVQFVFERECWPAGHGILRYSESSARFEGNHDNPILQRQAEAFLESYFRRR